MKYLLFCTIVCFAFFSCKTTSSPSGTSDTPTVSSRTIDTFDLPKEIQVAFYNIENLFDTQDNPNKIDEDFLPEGRYQWTSDKYQQKLQQLSTAIGAMGKAGPHVLGLAEVENATVVEELLNESNPALRKYEIIHEESPDARGIDVALAYDPVVFIYSSHKIIPYSLPEDPAYTSRDLLLVGGTIGSEPIYFMVNHWPSRREGQKESEIRRTRAAALARIAVDSLMNIDPEANIILMGDFNDDPTNKSISQVLRGEGNWEDLSSEELYNPMEQLHDPNSEGTLTYRGKWNLFDQILLSEELTSPKNALVYQKGSATIFSKELTVGFGRGSANPRRAVFRGKFDPEGYSDHFPVYVRLRVNQ
ncbi:MAG: endonuclease/exonuclease/phosphatase family protein [Bacteroidota bacterium]